MTAQSSSKFFGTYLKYRLSLMKNNLVMCCILNVLGLPLYAASANVGFGGVVSEFAMTARVFSTICLLALPAAAIFNALVSFDYYHQKDLTDTIGALSISHKHRFFADLLAGLIVNAAPIIPCGIICVIVMGSTQGKLLAYNTSAELGSFHMAGVGANIAVTVLLLVVLAYLFAALMCVCCGKIFHTVIFTVVGAAALPLLFGGLARCFANSIVGVDSKEYFTSAVTFFPPAGLFEELISELEIAFANDPVYAAKRYTIGILEPVHILVYVALAAGLTVLAYLLSKRRLAEHTGSAFAIKPAFWVICAGITAGATITTLAASYEDIEFYPAVAAGVGLLACVVTILLYHRKKKEILRSIILGAASVAVMLCAWVLINLTGSFGARYYPENPDKIEYIKVDNTYTITDKKDIKTYVNMLNNRLRNNYSDMNGATRYNYRGGFLVEVKRTNGKTTFRNYAGYGDTIFRSLDGYVGYIFDELEGTSDNWEAELNMGYSSTNVEIPRAKVPELIEILHEEMLEKHDPNAEIFATVIFNGKGNRKFYIEESFTRTIAFLEGVEDSPEKDPESIYLSIDYHVFGETMESVTLNIPFGDKDNEKVKELASLLEDCEGEDLADNFRVFTYYISGRTGVTEKNKARVIELMKELAADYIV